MSVESRDEIDWESPEVTELTASMLLEQLSFWWADNDRTTPAREKNQKAMTDAIQYAGQTLDGYQIARFLEDKAFWPADQALVANLANAASIRGRAIQQILEERRRANRPESPEPDAEGFYSVGTLFKVGDIVYQITGYNFGDFNRRLQYLVRNLFSAKESKPFMVDKATINRYARDTAHYAQDTL